jgi:hypothetical protein
MLVLTCRLIASLSALCSGRVFALQVLRAPGNEEDASKAWVGQV